MMKAALGIVPALVVAFCLVGCGEKPSPKSDANRAADTKCEKAAKDPKACEGCPFAATKAEAQSTTKTDATPAKDAKTESKDTDKKPADAKTR